MTKLRKTAFASASAICVVALASACATSSAETAASTPVTYSADSALQWAPCPPIFPEAC